MGGKVGPGGVEEPEGAKARLFGMVVREVSFVDRAANQRKFLLTKGETMAGKAATTISKSPAPAAGVPVATDPAATANSATADGSTAAAKLPAMQPQVKDQLLAALSSLAEQLIDISNQVKDAETDEKATGPAVPADTLASLGQVSQGISSLIAQYGGSPATETTTASTKVLEGITDNGGPDQQGAQKAAELEKAFTAMLEKAGRKMAKERMARLNQAISTLSQISRELKTEKGAALAKSMGVTGADLNEIVSTLETLTKAHKDQATENASLRAKVSELEKAVGPRNGDEPDVEPSATLEKAARPVAWPINMNRPIAPKSAATDFAAGRR